jgi:prepilin-type N-terminal cleavage/methylation domain-containing protein
MKRTSFSKSYRGFSLVETLVAMFIFVLVIGATSQIFTKAFVGYREEKRLQSDIESAQFALNTIAKELRTASIANFSSTMVEFIDYSQNKCFIYDLSGGALTVKSKIGTTPNVSDCDGNSYNSATSIVDNISNSHFSVTKSKGSPNPVVGKVTISLSVSSGTTTTNLQTSVSLRDYQVSGVQ